MIIQPTLNLNFAKARFPDPRINFSRPTSATYTDALGRIRTAGANEPRFDFDPVTGESLGLLIEESRTNLMTYSDDFTTLGRPWSTLRCSVTETTQASPIEGWNYWALIDDTTSSAERYLERTLSVTAGTFSYSLYVKSLSGNRRLWLRTAGTGAFGSIVVNLETGEVATLSGGLSATVKRQADGGYRVTVTGESAGSSVIVRAQPRDGSSSAGAAAYTGDGVSGLLLTGAQLEQGSFPTSYIPTQDAPVTRTEDEVVIPTSAFPFNPREGALLVAFRCQNEPSGTRFAAAFRQAASISSRMGALMTTGAGGAVRFFVADEGVTQADVYSGAYSRTGLNLSAFAYGTDRFVISTNGGAAAVDSSGTVPAVEELRLGSMNSSSYLNSHIERVAYFPRALDAATLQKLTEVPA